MPNKTTTSLDDIMTHSEKQIVEMDPWKLLRNYRDLKAVMMNAVDEHKDRFYEECVRQHVNPSEMQTYQEYMKILENIGMNFAGTAIESHARKMMRTKEMLDIVDVALTLLKNAEHGKLYYSILYHTYLSMPKGNELPAKNRAEVLTRLAADGYEIEPDTYRRKRKKAVEKLASMMWGCDYMFPLEPTNEGA